MLQTCCELPGTSNQEETEEERGHLTMPAALL